MLCFSTVLWFRWLGKSAPKRAGAEDRAPKMSPKFAPRESELEVWHDRGILEGWICKISTTLCCEGFGCQNGEELA